MDNTHLCYVSGVLLSHPVSLQRELFLILMITTFPSYCVRCYLLLISHPEFTFCCVFITMRAL